MKIYLPKLCFCFHRPTVVVDKETQTDLSAIFAIDTNFDCISSHKAGRKDDSEDASYFENSEIMNEEESAAQKGEFFLLLTLEIFVLTDFILKQKLIPTKMWILRIIMYRQIWKL
jgi:hypothetical protein